MRIVSAVGRLAGSYMRGKEALQDGQNLLLLHQLVLQRLGKAEEERVGVLQLLPVCRLQDALQAYAVTGVGANINSMPSAGRCCAAARASLQPAVVLWAQLSTSAHLCQKECRQSA